MPEIAPALLWVKSWNERSDAPRDACDRSFGELAQQRLERMKDQLDRIQVGRVLRQIAQACTNCGDNFLRAENFVSRKIVDHDDVSALERWRQALLEIGKEDFPVHDLLRPERAASKARSGR